MIFEALQSELFRFKFHSLSSKILKIPEFSLLIRWRYNLFGYFNNFFNKSISVNFLIWILAISSEHLKFSFWNSHSREHCHDVIGFNIEVIIRFKLAKINYLTFRNNFMVFVPESSINISFIINCFIIAHHQIDEFIKFNNAIAIIIHCFMI